MTAATMRRRRTSIAVCHYCKAELQPVPFYSAIRPADGLPVGVGWRICTPACPGRPGDAVVVAR